MRAAMIFCRATLGGICLLLVAGCAGGQSNPSVTANDPPLPQPAGNPSPQSVPPSAAPSPVSVVSPPPAASSAQPAPMQEPAAPLQSSSGVPVTTSPKDSGTSDTTTAFDNVDLVNANLVGKLAILRAGSSRTEDNLLSVFVGLKNETARVLQVEIQTIYKDSSGQALTQGTENWIPMKLKPHEEAQYRSVAISEDAADFLVRIRRAVPAVSTSSSGSGQ
ncbi:MAG: hypothetical protein LV481_09180 [Methylacidiphilales bacterium]|nr:hypothetical protein [Candidatus Methylacidiphilales bacterium]